MIQNANTTLFSVFGSFAILVLADFSGPGTRLVAYLSLAATGFVLITLGTLCSETPWLAVSSDGSHRFRDPDLRGDQRLLCSGRIRRPAALHHPRLLSGFRVGHPRPARRLGSGVLGQYLRGDVALAHAAPRAASRKIRSCLRSARRSAGCRALRRPQRDPRQGGDRERGRRRSTEGLRGDAVSANRPDRPRRGSGIPGRRTRVGVLRRRGSRESCAVGAGSLPSRESGGDDGGERSAQGECCQPGRRATNTGPREARSREGCGGACAG